MNTAAIHGLIKLDKWNSLSKVQINSKQVVDHILKRAREWPIVMLALIEMRFAHLIFMLNESEVERNADLFTIVERYFLRFFCINRLYQVCVHGF